MTEAEAIARALSLRPALGIDAAFSAASAERLIVEIVVGQPVEGLPDPGPREDHRAWVVTLRGAPFSVELTLDDASGDLLRLRRPRGVRLAPPPREGAR
jgi:hypothetical protein